MKSLILVNTMLANQRIIYFATSVFSAAIVGILTAMCISRFTGLFAPYWDAASGVGLLGSVWAFARQDIVLAVSRGWPIGLFMIPVAWLLKDKSKFIRLGVWVSVGALGGVYVSGGSYVYRGDWSQLVLAPNGLFAWLWLPVIHRTLSHQIAMKVRPEAHATH